MIKCRWNPQPAEQVIGSVAAATEGFAGADLQALCAAAVIAAVRRSAPGLLGDLDGHIRQQHKGREDAEPAPVAEALLHAPAPVPLSGNPDRPTSQQGPPPATPAPGMPF